MVIDPLSKLNDKLIDGLEFCGLVYGLFESLRLDDEGKSRLRMRSTNVEKKLIEELFPICHYVQSSYRAGRYIAVRWKDGDQTYDAELFQTGDFVTPEYYPDKCYLEVTCAMHPNDYLSRELLDTEGYSYGVEGIRRKKDRSIESIPGVLSKQDFIEPHSSIVIERILSKAKKPYPKNTTLIVKCTMNTIYMECEWNEFIINIQNGIESTQFDEIYIYDDVRNYFKRLFI